MAINQTNYATTPLTGAKTLTTGDTSRTAPATTQTLINHAAGSLIERIRVMRLATNTATVIRIFDYDGANYNLLMEIPLPAETLAAGTATVAITRQAVDQPREFPIVLQAGHELRVSINDTQAGGIKIIAEGGGF